MFDTRTVFLIASLTALVCAVMLWSLRDLHQASRAGMRLAAVAEVCLGGAMMMIALRGLVPDIVSIPLANAAGAVGSLVFYEAVRRLTGARSLARSLLFFAALIIAIQLYWGVALEYHPHRIILTSVVQGGAAIAMIPLLVAQRRIDAWVPLHWGIGFAAFFASAHALRLIEVLTAGVQVKQSGMVGGGLFLEVLVAVFSLTPMVFAMVMIGLVNGRVTFDFKRMANVDYLTGLQTRRHFFEVARHELLMATREPKRQDQLPVLMMLDLDHFKTINDSLGHLVGDAVLARFAWAMRNCAPADAVLGRYGGEEFCLLLPRSSMQKARQFATEIGRATRRLSIESAPRPLQLTVSIGIAVMPDDGNQIEDLIAAADRRVYLAKTAGRDRFVCTDTSGAAESKMHSPDGFVDTRTLKGLNSEPEQAPAVVIPR